MTSLSTTQIPTPAPAPPPQTVPSRHLTSVELGRNNNHTDTLGAEDHISFSSRLSGFLHLTPALLLELTRTLWSVMFLLVMGMFLTFNIQWSDQRWKHSNRDLEPLEDLGFRILPETDKIFLADLFMLTLLAGSICFTVVTAHSNIARLIIVRRLCWITGILMFGRTITISVTTLPSPKHCSPVDTGSFWFMFKQGVQLIIGGIKACTDNIYSGHTTFITTSMILLRVYNKYKWLTYYSYAHGITGMCLLIATRIHYTVDVLLALFVTYAVHSIYFFIVDLCVEKHFLHIRRAEQRLGDKDLYQRNAYIPNMFNTSLVGIIRWMDGLDIRFAQEDESTIKATVQTAVQRQEELAISRRQKTLDFVDQTVEMTQVIVEEDEHSRQSTDITVC